jgi:hypothetical protein
MAKIDRVIDIHQTPKDEGNWRLVTEELVGRGEAMARMISYAVAKEAFDALLEEIPATNDYEELRQSLKLVEVGAGKKGKEAAFAIHIPSKGRNIKKIDASKTVITVRAKKGNNPPGEDVLILEREGPWTADTIPFWPLKSEAVVVQRKSTKREVDQLAKDIKPKLRRITDELKEAGRRIKPYKPGSPGRIKRNAKAVPDLAMQALNLEFGGSGVKSKPVFRKVFGGIKRTVAGLANRFDEIKDAMTDPNSNKYKNWPKKMAKISSGQASKFMGFQRRLGL